MATRHRVRARRSRRLLWSANRQSGGCDPGKVRDVPGQQGACPGPRRRFGDPRIVDSPSANFPARKLIDLVPGDGRHRDQLAFGKRFSQNLGRKAWRQPLRPWKTRQHRVRLQQAVLGNKKSASPGMKPPQFGECRAVMLVPGTDRRNQKVRIQRYSDPNHAVREFSGWSVSPAPASASRFRKEPRRRRKDLS